MYRFPRTLGEATVGFRGRTVVDIPSSSAEFVSLPDVTLVAVDATPYVHKES